MLAKLLKHHDTNHRRFYRLEIWLFGCYCSGPCQHTHGKVQEWFWNTDRLYPAVLRVWHFLIQEDDWEG